MTFDLPKLAFFCRTERFGRSKVNIGRSKVNIGRSKVNIGRSKVTTPPSARTRHINFEHINFLNVGATLGQPAG